MCRIKSGMSVQLVSEGRVLFPDGSLYYLKDCTLETGARLVLAVGTEDKPPPVRRRVKPKPKPLPSDNFMEQDEISLADLSLKTEAITLQVPPPEPLPEPPLGVSEVAITTIGATLLWVLKKVSGLDNQLKSRSCAVRHQEAMTRIGKLEGKVLRKQIVDGGKFVKGQLDKRKEKASLEDIEEVVEDIES